MDVVFSRHLNFFPYVIRHEGALFLEFAGGADANHEPRTFRVPVSDAHLNALRSDFTRHLLVKCALLPLARAAGIHAPFDQSAALDLLHGILLGSESEVEALLREKTWDKTVFIAHHADPALLALGKIFEASRSLTEQSDPNVALEYEASRRHLLLQPLDVALLKYTRLYLHGGGLPSRVPEAVSKEFLPKVLEIIAVAEKATQGMELPRDYGQDYAKNHVRDKQAWNSIKDAVETALSNTFPDLQKKSVEAVSFLICSEAATRARKPRESTS